MCIRYPSLRLGVEDKLPLFHKYWLIEYIEYIVY